MIGVDIIKISRTKDLHDDFPYRILSSEELDRYLSFADDEENKARFLATRWAAKEAYFKASNNRKIDFRSISIMNDENGKPTLKFNNKIIGEVSLSHDDYAIAFVLLKE